MSAGTRFGWTAVAAIIIGLVSFTALVAYYHQRHHERSEVLGQRLISEFHQHLNSAQIDDVSDDSSPTDVRLKAVRSEMGKFEKLESCKIVGYGEPSWLTAQCVSWFAHGKVDESFIFRDYQGDNHLLSYSANIVDHAHSDKGKIAN